MKNNLWLILYVTLLLAPSGGVFAQTIPTDSMYLGQALPGNTPKVFNLPTAKGLRACERISISSNGKEIYFGELDGYPPGNFRVKCMKYLENKWQGPFTVFEEYIAPRLSSDDSILYLQNSNMVTFYSTRTDTGWSTPKRLLPQNLHSHYFQKSNFSTYASSYYDGSPTDGNICKLLIVNSDTVLQSLGSPLNNQDQENDFYIAPDESYILFSRNPANQAGDIYLSYKKPNGKWTNPKKLDKPYSLSGANWEYGEYVSHDGKYLFFTRGGNLMNSYYTYWVKIDNVIDSLRHNNFVPFLSNQIPDQATHIGQLFNYTVPDSTFTDDDGNNTLRYSATLSDGNPLPGWLSFDSTARTFSGIPGGEQSLNIKVIALDSANISAFCTFTLSVTLTGIKDAEGLLFKQPKLDQNFPNPFNPVTKISYQLAKSGFVTLKVYDALGKEVAKLVNEEKAKGGYSVTFNAANLPSGVYFYTLWADDYTATRKLIFMK